jgi:large conductance mechanosensitive channel
MKKIIKEFKDFISRGNVIDLATAVIIGGAFGKIVSSLVGDIIMPLFGALIGGGSFSDWKLTLRAAEMNGSQIIQPAAVLNIGLFIQNIIDFLIIAASVFLIIKMFTKLQEQLNKKINLGLDSATPKLTKDQELLIEIRDLLKNTPDNGNNENKQLQ